MRGQRGPRLTDLNHEATKRKGVVEQHDSARVADDLAEAAGKHARHEAEALPSDAEVGVDEAEKGKDGEEGGVGAQRGPVAIDARFFRADVQGAVGAGPKRRIAGGGHTRRHDG